MNGNCFNQTDKEEEKRSFERNQRQAGQRIVPSSLAVFVLVVTMVIIFVALFLEPLRSLIFSLNALNFVDPSQILYTLF